MIGRRLSRRANEENSHSPPVPIQSLNDDVTRTLDKKDNLPVFKESMDRHKTPHLDQSDDVSSRPQSDPFELFSGASFYLDAALDYQSLELDLSGEGLDLIPLPTVSPSVLQRPNDTHAFVINDGFSLEEEPGNGSWQFGILSTDGDEPMIQAAKARGPSVNEDNRQLIQHYLEVMKGYAKVDDRSKDTNNLFISAFSKSLSFPPLFYAILSFSASHLSMENPSYSDQAKVYDRLAQESFNQFAQDKTSTVDGLLSALFVRVKQIHVTAGNIDTFFELIAAALDIVRTEEVEKALADPSSLIRRLVIRLAILDARACHYGLGGGQLVRHLRTIPAVSSIFEREIGQASIIGDVNSLFRADFFRMHVAQLDMRIQDQLRDEFATLTPVRTEEIKSLYKSIQQQTEMWEADAIEDSEDDGEDIVEEEQLSSATYGRFTVLSALHSALLYLYTVYVSIFTCMFACTDVILTIHSRYCRLILRLPCQRYFITILRSATIHRAVAHLLPFCRLHCFLLEFVLVTQFGETGLSNVFARERPGVYTFERLGNCSRQLSNCGKGGTIPACAASWTK